MAERNRTGIMRIVKDMIFKVMPEVDRELDLWAKIARLNMPCDGMDSPHEADRSDCVDCPGSPEVKGQEHAGGLLKQALSSIRLKRFHALGGSAYSLLNPEKMNTLIHFIVALQTISDYLDNLCDRAGVTDERAFMQLHRSMHDAVCASEPEAPADYYGSYPIKGDKGYLESLVNRCRASLEVFPRYPLVEERMCELVDLYGRMQSIKHMHIEERWRRLEEWAEAEWAEMRRAPQIKRQIGQVRTKQHDERPRQDTAKRQDEAMWQDEAIRQKDDIFWWEFAAAAGSTLNMFALAAGASRPDFTSDESERINDAYFPWICGLHILLDYLIDLEEDRTNGDFNFVACYGDEGLRDQRLVHFVEMSLAKASALPDPKFHITIVQGLLGLYLSDPKVREQGLTSLANEMLKRGGKGAYLTYAVCRGLRMINKL